MYHHRENKQFKLPYRVSTNVDLLYETYNLLNNKNKKHDLQYIPAPFYALKPVYYMVLKQFFIFSLISAIAPFTLTHLFRRFCILCTMTTNVSRKIDFYVCRSLLLSFSMVIGSFL